VTDNGGPGDGMRARSTQAERRRGRKQDVLRDWRGAIV